MTTHHLKILPCYYNASSRGIKPWEIRKDDRLFREGDYLILEEYVPQSEWSKEAYYTGRKLYKKIIAVYSLPEYTKEGYVILSLRTMRKNEMQKLAKEYEKIPLYI